MIKRLLPMGMLMMGSVVSAGPWFNFRGDNQRTAITAEALSFPLSRQWQYTPLHKPAPAWPAPAVENLSAGSAKRLKPGEGLLTATLTYDRTNHVVSDGKSIYFGSSSDCVVQSRDLLTGTLRWEFSTEGPVRLAPAL